MTVELSAMVGAATLGMFCILAGGLLLETKSSNMPKSVLLLALGLALTLSCLVISIVLLTDESPLSLRLGFGIANAPNLIFFWLFIRALFEDDFSIDLVEISVGFVYTSLMVWERLADNDVVSLPMSFKIFIGVCSFGLIGHLIWSLLAGRPNDLVQNRRASRLWVVTLLIIAALVSIAATNGLALITKNWAHLFIVFSIFFGTLLVALYVMRPNLSRLKFEKQGFAPGADRLTAREQGQYKKLLDYIEVEDAFLDPKLTIGNLSKEIGLGEHTLRTLINKRLGYRNYTDFVNQYRIAHAKDILTQKDKAHVSILTIALDSGYNSLSAFNRAFRLIEGVTPSEFRKSKASA